MNKIENYDFNGKKVLVRVDFNVPLDANLQVTDDTRIVAALPTIKKIISAGGSPILISHLGRPKGKTNDKYSLRHVVACLSSHLNQPVHFCTDCIGKSTKELCNNLADGKVALLENLRFYEEETAGDVGFSKQLSE